MVKRIITSVVLLGIVLTINFSLATFPYVEFVVTILIALSAWEWSGFCYNRIAWRLGYSLLVVSLYLLLLPIMSPVIIVLCAILWGLGIFRIYAYSAERVQSITKALVSGLVLLMGFGMSVVYLHEQSPWAVFILLTIVASADSLALVIGRQWGRHKLAPLISPNKTWQGLYASMIGGLVIGIGLHILFDLALIQVVSMVLLVTLVSALGDLFISCYKREAGIKNTGTLLPGHGGILDRIDGLIAAAPVFAVLTHWADMRFVVN